MPSSATITLLGHLARDVELRKAGEYNIVGNAIPVTDKTKGGGETTTWYDVTFWGRDAEAVANFCAKGALLLINGSLSTRSYKAKDGTDKVTPTVKVSSFKIIDGKKDREQADENLADRF